MGKSVSIPWKKILLYGGIFLLFLVGIGVGYAAHLVDTAADMVGDSHEDVGSSSLRDLPVDPVEDNVSVLFIGVDDSEHRNETTSRSDALLLATFNQDHNSVKLLTIPRDSYVYIPEVGYSTKINHAHAHGGAKATIETVENFLNVPVDYFVRMDFNAFVDVVDALNGITFDVPYEFEESDSDDDKNSIHLYPGEQTLNGEEALALARTRKQDSDIARGKRQQEIMKAIADKAASASSILKLENVITAVGDHMSTNLSFPEIRGFLSYGLDKHVSIETVNFEGSGGYMANGGWYYQVEENSRIQIQTELSQHLEVPLENEMTDFAEDDVEPF
ncbi:LCP family protein [Virgibacillus ainsalahensis]